MPCPKGSACLCCLKQLHVFAMEGAQSRLESHGRRCL
jgi:hypothetical protein